MAASTRVSENNNVESNPVMIAHESNTDNKSEARIITRKNVDEQITFFALLTIQSLKLTPLIQTTLTAHRTNFSARAGTIGNN